MKCTGVIAAIGLSMITAAVYAETVAALPLDQGYYVAGHLPCGQASNATLMLVSSNGISSARSLCEFQKIQRVDATTFRAHSHCEGLEVDEGNRGQAVHIVTYEILARTAFRFRNEDGWSGSARRCAQSTLPEPWRGNDTDKETFDGHDR